MGKICKIYLEKSTLFVSDTTIVLEKEKEQRVSLLIPDKYLTTKDVKKAVLFGGSRVELSPMMFKSRTGSAF